MANHDDIALYRLPEAAPDGLPRGFELLRPIGMTTAAPETGTPHRHEYQEIILVEGGQATHTVDGQPRLLLPGSVALIGRGRVHFMLHTDDLTAWIVRFTEDFLPGDDRGLETDTLRGLFNPLGPGQTLHLPDQERANLHHLLTLIEDENQRTEGTGRDLAIGHLLAVLLLRLARYRTDEINDERLALPEYRVYQDFLILLEESFRIEHSVAFYAAALNVGPDYLSRALNRAVGKTAKQLIAERIALEAKRLLTYTSQSIKEIAQTLGFSDQFRFSKAFKAQTGLPPLAFRVQWRKVT